MADKLIEAPSNMQEQEALSLEGTDLETEPTLWAYCRIGRRLWLSWVTTSLPGSTSCPSL